MMKKEKKEIVPKATSANIEDTLQAIKTKFGDDAIMKLGEKPKVNINAISTGSIGLDAALGIGGLPRGRIVEIFGPESSGENHIISSCYCRGPEAWRGLRFY